MHMMMESGASYTVASLRAAIEARFGPTARFHTCSAENMTAEELVAFLAAEENLSRLAKGSRRRRTACAATATGTTTITESARGAPQVTHRAKAAAASATS